MNFILTFSVSASPLRLMAMGDMQGIVRDNNDYRFDVTAMPFIDGDNMYFSAGTVNYSNTINANPLYCTPDHERGGTIGLYDFAYSKQLDDRWWFFTSYMNMNVDSNMTYYATTGMDMLTKDYLLTTSKKGYFESTELGICYKALDWLVLGVASNLDTRDFQYNEDGIITSGGSGTVSNEYKDSGRLITNTVFIRFNNDSAYLSLFSKRSNSLSGSAGYQIIPGFLSINLLYDDKDSGIGKYGHLRRSAGGISITPSDDLTIAVGATKILNRVTWGNEITCNNIGAEYYLNKAFAVQLGAISKDKSLPGYYILETDKLLDLTCGMSYKVDDFKFEISALYYQDVPLSITNSWDSVPSYEISPLSEYIFFDHTDSEQRNLVIFTGLEYIF